MKSRILSIPQLGMIAGSRAVAGAGIGLLLANHMADAKRSKLGWTLFTLGALSTIPLVAQVLRSAVPSIHPAMPQRTPAGEL